MFKPWHSLAFGVVVFFALSLLSFAFPIQGVAISQKVQLTFPDLNTLFAGKPAKTDIKKILQAADAADAANTADTSFVIEGAPQVKKEVLRKDSAVKLITGIQTRNRSALKHFFDALN